MKKLSLGYLELSLAQCCIGINIILGKILIPEIPIFALLLLRFTLGFIFIGTYQALGNFSLVRTELRALSSKDWLIIFTQALCAGFLFNVLILYGLEHTTATVTGIINSAVPALVAVFSFLILREKLTLRIGIAILLCIVVIAVLGLGKAIPTDSNQNELLGILLILAAIVPEALFTVLAKLLKKPPSPLTTTLLINFFNMILFIPFAITAEWGQVKDASMLTISQIFLYSLTGGILFFVFWYRGLARISANTAALFMGIMPISTCILAYFALNEILGWDDLTGMILVIISIIIGTRKPMKKHKIKE
ncbi:MAG TPA: DMT family transporter [Gammaproteobacteria bacterium]|nr:DMT family transporter [Gammaproteobacteria bacterium]